MSCFILQYLVDNGKKSVHLLRETQSTLEFSKDITNSITKWPQLLFRYLVYHPGNKKDFPICKTYLLIFLSTYF